MLASGIFQAHGKPLETNTASGVLPSHTVSVLPSNAASLLSADTACVLSADTACVLPADIACVLPADIAGVFDTQSSRLYNDHGEDNSNNPSPNYEHLDYTENM